MNERWRWWRKKRFLLLTPLLFVLVYLAALGPAEYAGERGWLSPWAVVVLEHPADAVLNFVPRGNLRGIDLRRAAGDSYHDYLRWWWELGQRDAAASDVSEWDGK